MHIHIYIDNYHLFHMNKYLVTIDEKKNDDDDFSLSRLNHDLDFPH
jgi:hypothetical protein